MLDLNLPAGVYFLRINAGSYNAFKLIVVE